ncbi:hypothetical protein GO755_23105 [Spirosoma sp. HMF4905]|uniref:Uncharacterized protein n=1 Tax=Spirosoma arboris TaxID=2682092 RepID=A0A7K1SGW0_9BACT|nr:hypothetical protein [Spirosoma arboris]MVM32948.1 hypothetical protein [Spirosoma arboris]
MTPDRRLDQLEPLMADSLQKIDRLIEGQGQILEIATRADQKADTTAKGLANLTIKVNGIADKVDLLANDQTEFRQEVRQEFQEIRQEFGQKFDQVNQKFEQVNQKIDTEIGGLRQEINQRFDKLVTLIQDRLK